MPLSEPMTRHRHRRRQVGNDVGSAAVRELIHEGLAGLPDKRLHGADLRGGQQRREHLAHAPVFGRVRFAEVELILRACVQMARDVPTLAEHLRGAAHFHDVLMPR